MNEMEPKSPENEIIDVIKNKDSRVKRLTNRFVFRNKRMRSGKDDAEDTASDVILDDTVLNLKKKKKKTGSHCLAELHSFRSKFR